MRIQQTDQILKEARYARHHQAALEPRDRAGMFRRAWRSLTSVFKRS